MQEIKTLKMKLRDRDGMPKVHKTRYNSEGKRTKSNPYICFMHTEMNPIFWISTFRIAHNHLNLCMHRNDFSLHAPINCKSIPTEFSILTNGMISVRLRENDFQVHNCSMNEALCIC